MSWPLANTGVYASDSGPFDPSSVPDLVQWKEAEIAADFVLSGTAVERWVDRLFPGTSLGAGDLDAPTPSLRPSWTSPDDFVDFVPNRHLTKGRYTNLENLAGLTTFSVFRFDNFSAVYVQFCSVWAGQAFTPFFYNVGSNLRFAFRNGANVLQTHDVPIVAGQDYLVTHRWDGSDVHYYLDGVFLATLPITPAPATAAHQGISLGSRPTSANNFFDGRTSALLQYARDLTSVEQANIENYLMTKYSI